MRVLLPTEGSGANSLKGGNLPCKHPMLSTSLRRQDRIPGGRRTSIFEAQPAELNRPLRILRSSSIPGDDNRRDPELLEAEHRADAELHTAVVLLDKIYWTNPHSGNCVRSAAIARDRMRGAPSDADLPPRKQLDRTANASYNAR
jgi:hypothetical protein